MIPGLIGFPFDMTSPLFDNRKRKATNTERVKSMNETEIKDILDAVSRGTLDVKEAITRFKDFPIADMDFAKLDTHRTMRRGFPETILAEGKTTEHLIAIARKATENRNNTIITRTSESQRKALSDGEFQLPRTEGGVALTSFHHHMPT